MQRHNWRWFTALAVVALVAFAWGFLCHRNNLFPYPLVRSVGLQLGLVRQPPPRKLKTSRRVERINDLRALPYLSGHPDTAGGQRGVVKHDPARAFEGWNLYASRRESQALLLTMDGDLVHRWRFPSGSFNHVQVLPNGDLLALLPDDRLVRLSKSSQVLWEYKDLVHHDLWLDESNGDIWVLVRRPTLLPARNETIPVLVDSIVILSEDGAVKDEIDLFRCFENSAYSYLIPETRSITGEDDPLESLDILHTNHVEKIVEDSAKRPEVFKAGNVIVSVRNLNSIAVIDLKKMEVVWLWGPNNLIRQHHSTLLANGNLLVFDNGISQSRVLEVDPVGSGRIVWQYGPNDDFFSVVRGSNQRLPNGNTLITESVKGRAFEVTPSGEIVWEFYNHDLDEEGERGSIWRVIRLNPDDFPDL